MSHSIQAQEIDRTTRPPVAPPPAATFPDFETFTLENGLKVFLVQDPRPTVTLRLLVPGGKMVEGESAGLVEALADQLQKGAGEMTAAEFAEEIDFLGGSISASADDDAMSVTAGGLKKHIDRILDLYALAVTDPTFPEEELQKYKTLAISALEANKKDPSFLASAAMNKVLYGDTPLGRMTTEADLRELSVNQLRGFHSTWFAPNNATLAIVGDLDVDEARELISEHFGDWERSTVPPLPDLELPDYPRGSVVLVDRPTSVQSSVMLVGPGPAYNHPDRRRAYLLNSIFGGGTGLGNRLASNLRETHGWTYSPYSYMSSNLARGRFVAAAQVRNEVTDSTIVEIRRELDTITSVDIPAEELDRNIKSAVGNYLMSLANPSITASRVQSIDFYGLPANYYETLVADYTGTNQGHLRELARKYLDKSQMAIVVVGKASEVRESLDKFGEVVVWDANLNEIREMSAEEIGVTAEEAWSNMLQSMGGRENLRKVKSLSLEGSADLQLGPQQMSGTFRQVSAYPNKQYVGLVMMGMPLMEQYISADEVALFQQGQRMPLPEEEAARVRRESHIIHEAWLDEIDGDVKLIGMRETEGRETLVVEMTIAGESPQTYYLDPETYLPVRVETANSQIDYTSWEKIDGGVKQPGGMKLTIGPGATVTISDIQYTVNGTVDDAIFRPGE